MPKCEMLINCAPGEECRIAIVHDGRLEEIYQERASNQSHVGNIYNGKVTNVEPSIGAAFIDFGLERNGFLHITDLHPKYFSGNQHEDIERVGHKTPRSDRPPIQRCLRRGQEILVQILKEGIGTKGPTLTSYLSIPGRFLVMMPDMERLGVSRKVEDDDQRRQMRKLLELINPPKNFGFIVRTAGTGRTRTELRRDLAYLQRLWSDIEKRRKALSNVGELYAESDLVIRTIRDVFSPEIERIVVDDTPTAQRASDFLSIANPRSGSNVMVYRDPVPLFRRFGIEAQMENINRREVELPSGGSLVIEQTEALVAIDVNSGKMRQNRDAETTAYKTNIEAADEICRQLRLRDLGGVIINDLIDMVQSKHRRAIEQQFRNNLKRDRARTRTSGISQFGILEMTRQRMRPSLQKATYIDCPQCRGAGAVKSPESVVLEVMRRLAAALHQSKVVRVELTIGPDVAFQLLNRKRSALVELESRYDKHVMVRVNGAGPIDLIELAAYNQYGASFDVDSLVFTGSPDMDALETVDPADLFDRRMDQPLAVAVDGEPTGKRSAPTSTRSGGSGGATLPDAGEELSALGRSQASGKSDAKESRQPQQKRSRRGVQRRNRQTPSKPDLAQVKDAPADKQVENTNPPRRTNRKKQSGKNKTVSTAPVSHGYSNRSQPSKESIANKP